MSDRMLLLCPLGIIQDLESSLFLLLAYFLGNVSSLSYQSVRYTFKSQKRQSQVNTCIRRINEISKDESCSCDADRCECVRYR